MSVAPPKAGESILESAVKVLTQADPTLKAEYTNVAVQLWRSKQLQWPVGVLPPLSSPPSRPARSDDLVKVVPRHLVPDPGKGSALASRQARLHSLVHIENWAIDLSWDIIARFGGDKRYGDLPYEFFDDWVTVAEDECRHFLMLRKRLEELGLHYGAFPAHDGLWESAEATAHSLPARLAVEHCVHEARGLDVLPATIRRFRGGGDVKTAVLLEETIYPEEVSHCAAGVRWLKFLHRRAHGLPQEPLVEANKLDATSTTASDGNIGFAAITTSSAVASIADHDAAPAPPSNESEVADCAGTAEAGAGRGSSLPMARNATSPAATEVPAADWAIEARQFGKVEEWFVHLVRGHFKGGLKPPFNDTARAKAGFGPEWYLPLVMPAARPAIPAVPAAAAPVSSTAAPTPASAALASVHMPAALPKAPYTNNGTGSSCADFAGSSGRHC